MNIVVLAVKECMRLDMKFDIGITRRSAAEARHPLFFQSQRLPILGALGDPHLQRLAFRKRNRSCGAVGSVKEADRKHVAYILAARPHRASRLTCPT